MAGKPGTTVNQLEKYLMKSPKLLRDLLKDPMNPNVVLEKYRKAPLTADALRKWRVAWTKIIYNVIGPGLINQPNWGDTWPHAWDPGKRYLPKR